MQKKIVQILNSEKGENIKVNFTGAWDRYDVKSAHIAVINIGAGFEDAVICVGSDGKFLYMPPFKIGSMPTSDDMFTFYASDAVYIASGL